MIACCSACERRGELCPRSPDTFGCEHTCLVGRPASASRADEPISSVALEDAGGFVLSARSDGVVFACEVEEVICEFADEESEVFLR